MSYCYPKPLTLQVPTLPSPPASLLEPLPFDIVASFPLHSTDSRTIDTRSSDCE